MALIPLLWHCANPVAPQGGPKDVTPPRLVKAEPGEFSRNFTGDRIRIYFDEFIQLKDYQKQLMISPPPAQMPTLEVKGKMLEIRLKEELKPETTYNFFFGNSVVDITENNPVPAFRFVVSTGNTIDSLSLAGTVADAYTLEPEKEIFVMLYHFGNDTIHSDSLPLLAKPAYVTRSGPEGGFRFDNLSNGPFKIFALKDVNSNFIYDLPNEKIAFLTDSVRPFYDPTVQSGYEWPQTDTLQNDTLPIRDTTLLVKPKLPDSLRLYVFTEPDTVQRLLKKEFVKSGHLLFVFRQPAPVPSFRLLNWPVETWFRMEQGVRLDSVNLWLTGSLPDSLRIEVSDCGHVLDTSLLVLKFLEKGKWVTPPVEKLKVQTTVKSKSLDLNRPLTLAFGYPLTHPVRDGLVLLEDSIPKPVTLSYRDGLLRKADVVYPWIENTSYRLIIPDSLFTGLPGNYNDSLTLSFKTRQVSDYGNVKLKIILPGPGDYLLEILNDKDLLLSDTILREDAVVRYPFLAPGTYRFKVTADRNRNGKWDTGIYLRNLQPERVAFMTAGLDVRANWDFEETWEVKFEQ